jgi:hypothetical protein
MSWNDILSEVQTLEERFRQEGSLAWYRGHRDAGWFLTSRLHRFFEDVTRGVTPPLGGDSSMSQ